MQWFKHHTDARTRTGLQLVMEAHGMAGYGCYFALVEMCVAKWDMKEPGWERCEFRFTRRQLRIEFRSKSDQSRIILGSFQHSGLITFTECDNLILIKFPNLLKFLNRDVRYNQTKRVRNAEPARYRTEEDKEEEEEGNPLPPLGKIWNEHSGTLRKVQLFNANRLSTIAERWSEWSEAQWVDVVQKIARSEFCTGRNDRGWRADFDWLLKPDTAMKVLEGKFDSGSSESWWEDFQKFEQQETEREKKE